MEALIAAPAAGPVLDLAAATGAAALHPMEILHAALDKV
jgi:hypothetical protein